MINLLKLSREELKAITEYKEVFEKDKRFKKNFWSKEIDIPIGERVICRVLTRYALEDIEKIKISELPEYYLTDIKDILIENKLFTMVQRVFSHNTLEVLKNAYPEEFKTRVLKDWMWSKHNIWDDKDKIIEAVREMVMSEGIRWIYDIAKYDWKRRLIKHGIYGVLSRFNWSIYEMFNFVYPDKFHPADFKYKNKWTGFNAFKNAYHLMHKTFRSAEHEDEDIYMLSISDFRKLGLGGMLLQLFNSSAFNAKEYYFFETTDNKENQRKLIQTIKSIRRKKTDIEIKKRLFSVSKKGKITAIYKNYTAYSYIKRYAKIRDISIKTLIENFGFIYETQRDKATQINPDDLWDLRKQRLSWIEISEKLGSNPTTVNNMCDKLFGGDPLIPRPIEKYVTVQSLMNKYRVDHKTVMKIVKENNLEDHTTIRLRYLNKKQIEPLLRKYIKNSKHHSFMIKRYS